MKFTITNGYKPLILSLAIVSFSEVKAGNIMAETQKLGENTATILPEAIDSSNLLSIIASKISQCQNIDPDYQEIYSFETENHQINICQLGSNYYYHRQSKLDSQNDLLIPAEPVFGGSVFQAINGKTIYFVGQNGDRYYSSVMLNNDEMIFEPELVAPPTFAREKIDSEVNFSFGAVKLSNFSASQPEEDLTASAEDKSKDIAPICIQNESVATSSLEGWQNLLGKSSIAANMYAIDRGHHFVYNRHTPEQALIKTKEGTIVNLGIASSTKTIEEVCIQPLGSI